MECPMRPSNDLSRSLVPFDCDATVIATVELSQKTWLVGGIVPGINRHPEKKIGPDEQALLRLLLRWRDEAGKAGCTITRIAVAFEAGRDGFWLARWLRARGIEAYVIHPTSIPVSREHRRAKTDRLDPAILILIFGGLRAWASRYIRKRVRRSRREWWWLGEGEREKQIVPGGEDQERGDRRQLVEEVVAWSELCPCGAPKIVANVADGMDCEGEQVQGGQNGREVLFSVAEAVFEVVALVFENVEGFVLDLPSRPAAGCEFNDVFAADRQIGDEAVAIGRLALGVEDLDLKPVDLERIIAGP